MKMKKGKLHLSESERQTISEAMHVLEKMQDKETDEIGKETIDTAHEALTVIHESYPEE